MKLLFACIYSFNFISILVHEYAKHDMKSQLLPEKKKSHFFPSLHFSNFIASIFTPDIIILLICQTEICFIEMREETNVMSSEFAALASFSFLVYFLLDF